MRVLVACEYSGIVRQAFRAIGHEAWSCDLYEPAEDGSQWHISGDAVKAAYEGGWFCKACHAQSFSTAGRKKHLSGDGWSCAACVAKRGDKK